MNKSVKLGLSSLITPVRWVRRCCRPRPRRRPGFVCPAGSDTIPARYGTAADGTPAIAGTVVRVRRHHGVPLAGRDGGLARGGEGCLRFLHDRRHLHPHRRPRQGRGHLQVRPLEIKR
jgi:hypothetical protein